LTNISQISNIYFSYNLNLYGGVMERSALDRALLTDRLDWNLLRTFLTIVHERSLSRAAVRLHITQPAVSLALRRLEEHLGHTLIERRGSNFRLTRAGEEVLRIATDVYGSVARLGAELAVVDKRRTEDGTAEVMNVIGDVEGRTCILQDDIIDTAGTIQKAAIALKENGAERVLACAVHGVLSGPAIDRIEKAPLDQLIVTNSIPLSEAGQKCKKIVVLSVARLLGQAIRNIHEETSVSSLFV